MNEDQTYINQLIDDLAEKTKVKHNLTEQEKEEHYREYVEGHKNYYITRFKNIPEERIPKPMPIESFQWNLCCLCERTITDDPYGNNAEPFMSGICCKKCNDRFVLPLRIMLVSVEKENEKRYEEMKRHCVVYSKEQATSWKKKK